MIIAVLAGGKSKRFGKDKLLAIVDGRTAIERVIENVRPDLLLTTSKERCRLYWNGPCVIDRGEGPASAILELDGEVLVVPGDMPWLKFETLEMLVSYANVLKADVAMPLFEGSIEFSVLYLRDVGKFRWMKKEKCRSLRITDFVRAGGKVALVGSELLTRNHIEWAHLNTPLSFLTKEIKGKPCSKIVLFEANFNPFQSSVQELKLYRKYGLKIIEDHVLKDLSLLRSQGGVRSLP